MLKEHFACSRCCLGGFREKKFGRLQSSERQAHEPCVRLQFQQETSDPTFATDLTSNPEILLFERTQEIFRSVIWLDKPGICLEDTGFQVRDIA